MSKVFFPGSFDPFTIGHADLVERALRLFDQVVIGIGYNEQKQGTIPVEERLEALRQFYARDERVTILSYQGLTTEAALSCGAAAMLRGVRSTKDYDYELQMADVNHRLCPQLDTIVLLARPDLACCSSSIARELWHFGQDLSAWIPAGLHYPTFDKR